VDTGRPSGFGVYEIVEFAAMEFLRRRTLVTIVVVFMMLLEGEAQGVEGLPAKGVKEPLKGSEPNSEQDKLKEDKLKEEPQLDENSLKEGAPAPVKEAAEQGEGGEKKGEEETSNSKAGGDDDGGTKESADANGGDAGHSGTELEKLQTPAGAKNNGEATNTKAEDVPPTLTLDQSTNMTTNSNSTQITNSPGPGSDANVNGMDKTTDSHDTETSAGGDTMVSDGSSSIASSFGATGSSSSSAPPVDNQEIPPPGKPKPTESNSKETNQKEDSGSGKTAANEEPKIAKLEESDNGLGKEVASPEEEAKGSDPDPMQESKPADSDNSKTEEGFMDVIAPEAKEESKVDTPMETSFEKRMGSGAADPPQSNFFSYFIVLAIITIIAYLVFHNKKKIVGLIVEGRSSGRQAGRRRSGGREYRKLDSNMEDMMETGRETSMRQVIY